MNNTKSSLILCLVLATLLSGCDSPTNNEGSNEALSLMVGERVRVQFRRDALGAAASLPISPMTGQLNGASTTLVGNLTKAEPSAIVVELDGKPHWIPREVILLVQAMR